MKCNLLLPAMALAIRVKLKDAVTFFREVGEILNFDDPHSPIGTFVIIDPMYLSAVMRTVVSFKHRFGLNGRLKASDLKGQLLRVYPAHLQVQVLRLLLQFGILHPVVTEASSGIPAIDAPEFFVPCFLPMEPPRETYEIWLMSAVSKPRAFRRDYFAKSLPIGFFSQVLSRVMHIPGIFIQIPWKCGLVLSLQDSSAKLILKTIGGTSGTLIVETRESPKVSDLQLLIVQIAEAIDDTVRCLYRGLDLRKQIACSGCLSDVSKQPFLYNYDDVALALATQNSSSITLCSIHKKIIPSMAPDLALENHTVILLKDICILDELGKGSFGTVSKGLWHGQTVAVKKLLLQSACNR